jgi:hypothetical protein
VEAGAGLEVAVVGFGETDVEWIGRNHHLAGSARGLKGKGFIDQIAVVQASDVGRRSPSFPISKIPLEWLSSIRGVIGGSGRSGSPTISGDVLETEMTLRNLIAHEGGDDRLGDAADPEPHVGRTRVADRSADPDAISTRCPPR